MTLDQNLCDKIDALIGDTLTRYPRHTRILVILPDQYDINAFAQEFASNYSYRYLIFSRCLEDQNHDDIRIVLRTPKEINDLFGSAFIHIIVVAPLADDEVTKLKTYLRKTP